MTTRIIHLTRDGFERLTQELNRLQTVERPRILANLQNARGQDGEGEEARSEQGFVERRIRELRAALLDAQIVDPEPDPEVVSLGSRVTVVDDHGDEERYRIVGPIEASPRQGLISEESPVGQALIGRRVGDFVSVSAPGGRFELVVVAIG